MRLLNAYASHLPASLRRVAAAATPGGTCDGSVGGSAGSGGGKGRASSPAPRREHLRPRNLLVRGKACRSEMGVAQKHINFGKVAVRCMFVCIYLCISVCIMSIHQTRAVCEKDISFRKKIPVLKCTYSLHGS